MFLYYFLYLFSSKWIQQIYSYNILAEIHDGYSYRQRSLDGHKLIVRKTKNRSKKNFHGEEWKDLPRVLQPWQQEILRSSSVINVIETQLFLVWSNCIWCAANASPCFVFPRHDFCPWVRQRHPQGLTFCWWDCKAGCDIGHPSHTLQWNSPQAVQTPAGLGPRAVIAQHTERQTTGQTHEVLTHRFSPYTSAANRGPQPPALWGRRRWEPQALCEPSCHLYPVCCDRALGWGSVSHCWLCPPQQPCLTPACPLCVSDSHGCLPVLPGALCPEIWDGATHSEKLVELAAPMLNKNTG